MLALPANWTSIAGLCLDERGIHGTALVSDGHTPPRILCFTAVNVVEVSTQGWSIGEIVECLSTLQTPRSADPILRSLTEGDLKPLKAIGSLSKMDALRLLSMVPTWRP